MLIGGAVIGVVVVAGLFYLLFDAISQDGAPEPDLLLSEYCQENPERCPGKGSTDAPVEIVEVSDYGCGFCGDFNVNTAPLLEDLYVRPGEVRWLSLPFALGQATEPAAEASLCAADQDKYFEFHEYLFENQGDLQALMDADFGQASAALGLDTEAFSSCVDSRKYADTVQENKRVASRAGVRGTPTFFINDEVMRVNPTLTNFQGFINRALSASQ